MNNRTLATATLAHIAAAKAYVKRLEAYDCRDIRTAGKAQTAALDAAEDRMKAAARVARRLAKKAQGA